MIPLSLYRMCVWVNQRTVIPLIVSVVGYFLYAFMPSSTPAHKCLWQTFILCFILKSNLWLNVNDIEFSQCARIFYQFEHFSKKHTKTHCFPWINNEKHVCTLSFMHSLVTQPPINPCVVVSNELPTLWHKPSLYSTTVVGSCFSEFSKIFRGCCNLQCCVQIINYWTYCFCDAEHYRLLYKYVVFSSTFPTNIWLKAASKFLEFHSTFVKNVIL